MTNGLEIVQAAREGWAAMAAGKRWTLWVRLSFAKKVSDSTASDVMWDWSMKFRREMPGTAVLFGFHNDKECRHAHALIFIPRRYADPYHPPGDTSPPPSWKPWLQSRWSFGQVWAREYDSSIVNAIDSSPHGAAEYLARDPGSVMQVGTAPLIKNFQT